MDRVFSYNTQFTKNISMKNLFLRYGIHCGNKGKVTHFYPELSKLYCFSVTCIDRVLSTVTWCLKVQVNQ